MTSPCIFKMCPQPASAPSIPKGHHGTRGTLGGRKSVLFLGGWIFLGRGLGLSSSLAEKVEGT